MKTLTTLLFLLIACAVQAQHTLEKIWESDSTLAIPESVLYDRDGLFVSLIDGQPWVADSKGGIARLDKNGKITNLTWVTGLQAPKGMALEKKKLYVADMTDVVVINVASGKIESRIPVEGSKGLNDVTIVSDSQGGKIFTITKGKSELYIPDTRGVNGLKAVGKELYICLGNGLYKASDDKKLVLVSTMQIGGDGIEPVGNGDYIVSCWQGLVFYMTKDGVMQQMLDTRPQKTHAADIGYNTKERIVYVPTFAKKSVVAYKVK
jgi:hypothetical protein